MHIEARNFTVFIKTLFPEFFKNIQVLDVGAGDINGNNRFLFENCEYEGNDLVEAKNVTIINKTKDLKFEDNRFDTIISTECFEHDAEYTLSLQNIIRMLKPNGMFVFTCASYGRPEHGTKRTTPNDSYGTIGNLDGFTDYYKNLELKDINNAINLEETFSSYRAFYNKKSQDIYFVGFKKGEKKFYIPKYEDANVIEFSIHTEFVEFKNLDLFNRYQYVLHQYLELGKIMFKN